MVSKRLSASRRRRDVHHVMSADRQPSDRFSDVECLSVLAKPLALRAGQKRRRSSSGMRGSVMQAI